jgi:uncharacterized protein YxeA
MLNIADDYVIFDNKETITFQNQGDSVITITDVTRRPAVIATESSSGTTYYSTGIEFLIWKNSVLTAYMIDGEGSYVVVDDSYTNIDFVASEFIPRLNATIIDKNGKKYNVDLIDDGVLRSRWSVKATSQAAEGIN